MQHRQCAGRVRVRLRVRVRVRVRLRVRLRLRLRLSRIMRVAGSMGSAQGSCSGNWCRGAKGPPGADVANGPGCVVAAGQSAGPGNILVGVARSCVVGATARALPMQCAACTTTGVCAACALHACTAYALHALRYVAGPVWSSHGCACRSRRRRSHRGAARSAQRERGGRRTTGGSWTVNQGHERLWHRLTAAPMCCHCARAAYVLLWSA
jgi:hypothetical protein